MADERDSAAEPQGNSSKEKRWAAYLISMILVRQPIAANGRALAHQRHNSLLTLLDSTQVQH